MNFQDDRIYSRRSQPAHGQQGRWQGGGEFEHDRAPSASDYGSDYDTEASSPSVEDLSLHPKEEFYNSGETVVEAVKNFFGVGPRDYLRSDTRIQEDVSEIFLHDRFLDASGIEVSVAKGVVTLEGLVPDRASKWRAEDLTDAVHGLKEVRNLLRTHHAGDANEEDFPHSEDGSFTESGLRRDTNLGQSGHDNLSSSPR